MRWHLAVRRRLVATTDAVVKMCHYEKCGKAQRNIAPRVPQQGCYFGVADTRVRAAQQQGTFGKVRNSQFTSRPPALVHPPDFPLPLLI
jgi:hypothetical protein